MAQAIPIALTLASSALSAGGTIAGARSQAHALKDEANQLDAAAVTDRASSQRAAIDQRRQARLLASRTQAIAAAQGGASDPTVANLIAKLSGEGEYRALTALYEGEESAGSKEMQAIARRKEAKGVKTAGYLSAGGTLLQGASTLYNRYGNNSNTTANRSGR